MGGASHGAQVSGSGAAALVAAQPRGGSMVPGLGLGFLPQPPGAVMGAPPLPAPALGPHGEGVAMVLRGCVGCVVPPRCYLRVTGRVGVNRPTADVSVCELSFGGNINASA